MAEPGEPAGNVSWPSGPSIVGEAGILMEVSTGTILYSKNVDAQYYPASITKILTALIVLENCDLNEWVKIPYEAVYMEDKGSHIALDVDEEVRVEDCLYALMLASANEVAHALAVHVGGSIEGFAEMMNAKARELGCKNSNFVNPHGLPDENHLTSAYDMALITREALKSDVFRQIAGTTFYEIQPSVNQPDLIPMSQHHDMLTGTRYHYDGAFVGKTGYTTVAKNTLVTCAARDGMELICVTMKTEGKQVYIDTAALFDFGFEEFQKISIGSSAPSELSTTAYADAVRTGEELRVSDEVSVSGEQMNVPVKIIQDGNVVVPKSVSFGELTASLHYDEAQRQEGAGCLLAYNYGNRRVGSAEITLPNTLVEKEIITVVTPEPRIEVVEEDPVEKEGGFHWWYIPLGLAAAVVVIGGGFLVIRRIIWQRRWRKRRRRHGRLPGYSTRHSDWRRWE